MSNLQEVDSCDDHATSQRFGKEQDARNRKKQLAIDTGSSEADAERHARAVTIVHCKQCKKYI